MGDAWDVEYLIRCRVARNSKDAGVLALKAGLDMNNPDTAYEEIVLGKLERAPDAQLAETLEEGQVFIDDIDRPAECCG
ncbi:TPA: hypothetical protein EYN65_05740 [Candidatus Poribacteria bacterium]|nr:hypothetical protein [Candidatus Poribacteria bacterium]